MLKWHTLVCFFLFIIFDQQLKAELVYSRSEIIQSAKPAAVFIETDSGSGSGVCIHPSGLILTNAHVVEGIIPSSTVNIVWNSSTPGEKIIKAILLRKDEVADLALLKATGTGTWPFVQIRMNDKIQELDTLYIFGFPFGDELSIKKDVNPAVTINMVNISSLRYDDKKLVLIQVDSNLNPGNSGGPAINDHSELSGLVFAGIQGAGINLLIPAEVIRVFLEKPVISFKIGDIRQETKNQMTDFEVTVMNIPPKEIKYSVELNIHDKSGEIRKYSMKEKSNNTFFIQAVPVIGKNEKYFLPIELHYENSTIIANATNQEFTINKKNLKIEEVDMIKFLGDKTQVILKNGETISGPISGLDRISVSIDNCEYQFNLNKAEMLATRPLKLISFIKGEYLINRYDGETLKVPFEEHFKDGNSTMAEINGTSDINRILKHEFIMPQRANNTSTYLKILSTSGDYIGQGESHLYNEKDMKNLTGGPGKISINVEGWRIELSPGRGNVFENKIYKNATRYPFNQDGPGFSFSGHGRGSNQLSAEFAIWELVIENNIIKKLAIDFVQHSEIKGPPLAGMLRYNSTFE